MSQADVERFVADLQNDEGLRNELSGHASGVGSVVAFAQEKGYDVSADEASAYISAQAGRDLSDAELDAVAGGKGHSSNQTSTSATNVATTAEAVTEVAAATSAATAAEVAAVAVAVIVLT